VDFVVAMQYTIPLLENVASICKLFLSETIAIEFICGGGLLSSRCKLRNSRYPPSLGSREHTLVEQGDS
jgi:hypothetical protein